MSVTTVRLKPEIEKDLAALAEHEQRSKSWLINDALASYLQRRDEDQQRWQQTLDAMQSVARGEVVSGEAVHGWLSSWGSMEELPPPKVGE